MKKLSLVSVAFLRFPERALSVFCLCKVFLPLQSVDLDHAAYLTAVSLGQAVLWDVVGAWSNSASCCLLPF